MSTSFFVCLDNVKLRSVPLFHFKLYLLVNTRKLLSFLVADNKFHNTFFQATKARFLKQSSCNHYVSLLSLGRVKRSFMCLVITVSSSIDDNDSSENVTKE